MTWVGDEEKHEHILIIAHDEKKNKDRKIVDDNE